jgi:hypothetical protein
MTIKTQGGKVITKGGKVSCECCEDPTCCMYPADRLNIDYGFDDLPDAVTVDGTSFNRSSTSYGDTTNGVIFENGIWAKYSNGVRSERPCLIQGGVEDEFADSYTMSGGPFSFSVTVTRVSLCIWRGADGCGNMAYLVYGDDISLPFPGTDYRWSVALPFYNDPTLVCENIEGRTVNVKENQNTPDGVYESIPGQPLGQTITVS